MQERAFERYIPLKVNKSEFSVYTVKIFMKCTNVCSAQKAY